LLSVSLYLSLSGLVSTDKQLLAAEGAAHFWLDKDFYYIDIRYSVELTFQNMNGFTVFS
jgi:hypothetical protein